MGNERYEFIRSIEFTSPENFNQCRDYLTSKVIDVIDTYEYYNTPNNAICLDYTVAGIYLALKKVLPEGVSFRIDYRKKSSRSTQKTTSKEILDKSTSRITKDIFGVKVIITDITGILSLETTDEKNKLLLELQNQKIDNSKFINETRTWINSSQEARTEDKYYKKLIELLERLEASTYPQCVFENETPYDERLEKVKKIYARKKDIDNLSLSISKEQSHDIDLLIKDLENRLNDRLEHELLKVFLPKALSSNLVSNILQVNYVHNNERINDNGYVADFSTVTVGNKFKFELQTQSYYRYLCGKKGVSFHNGRIGKSINIDSLFELVNDNDSHPIEYYLELLNQVPIDIFETGILEEPKTKLIEKVEEAYNHIKIKDTINFSSQNDSNDSDTNCYLMNLAKHVSADMFICRSAHNFNTPTVNIENNGLSTAFADVLRKRDGISCLAQLLVDRVSNIIDTLDNNSEFKPNRKQLTIRDIISYAKTFPQNDKNTNLIESKKDEETISL